MLTEIQKLFCVYFYDIQTERTKMNLAERSWGLSLAVIFNE